MTDQSKIPVPGNADADKEASRISSLERASGKGFDLNSFIAAPIPAADIPDKPRRVEKRADPEKREAAQEDVPAKPEARIAADAPAAPLAEPAALPEPAPVPAPEPVVFTGKKHPVKRDHLRDQGLIVPEGNVTALLEEFRIVRRKVLVNAAELRRQNIGPSAQRILVSSPHSGEGKTYCSVNLAMAIAAEKESEVLLVDSDFAKPSILSMLGIPGGPGLMDALVDREADVADFVIGTDIPGLWVLPAGNTTNSDTEYLNSSRTLQVLDRLTQGATNRIVLFDTPPVLAASTAATLAKYVSQSLVVVRADRTSEGSLDDTVSLLSACPNIELLLNAVHFSPSGRKFGTYYSYGG